MRTGTSSTPMPNPSSVACTPAILVGVEIGVRLVVARQELLQRQGARRVPGPDEDDASRAPGHEQGAPEDERAQKDLAQLRVRHDEAAHALRGDLEHAARAARARPDDGGMPGDHVDVAGKIAGAVDGDDRVPFGEDLDLALEHDHERTVQAARLEQDFAGLEVPLASERRDPLDLRRRQGRENLLRRDPRIRAFRAHVPDPAAFMSNRFTGRGPTAPGDRRGGGRAARRTCGRRRRSAGR